MSSIEPEDSKGKAPQRESSEVPFRPKMAGGFDSFKRLEKGIKVYPFEIKKLSEDNARNWFGTMQEELLAQNAWVAVKYCQKVGVDAFLQEREINDDLYMYDLKASMIIRKGLSEEIASDVRQYSSALQKWEYLKERFLRPSNSRKAMKFMELADLGRIERHSELVKGWYEFKAIMMEFIEMNGSSKVEMMDICLIWYLWSFSSDLNALRDSIMATDVITEEFMLRRLSDRDNLDRAKGKELIQKAAETPKCFRCNRLGHMAADCYSKTVKDKENEKKNPKKEGQSSRRPNRQKARAVVGDEDEERTLVSSGGTDDEFGAFFIEEELKLVPTFEWARRVYGHSTKWCFDSGATSSCTGDRSLFEEMKPCSGTLSAVNGDNMTIEGRGVVQIQLPQGKTARLAGVIYVPGLEYNLLSLEALHLAGLWTIGSEYGYYILRDGQIVAEGKRYGKTTYLESVKDLNSLYVDRKRRIHIVRLALTQEEKIVEKQALVHSRLGHPGRRRFNHCVESMDMNELKLDKRDTMLEDNCEICIRAKQVKKQNHKQVPRASRPLQRVYMDFWGPNRDGAGEEKYYLSLIDDCTRFSWLFVTTDRKVENVEAILNIWCQAVERQAGQVLLVIRTDNALEFHALKPWCSAKGIELEFIEPDTPPQNGVAERFNRIILEVTRALLFDARVGKRFWKYAVVTANYIRNLTTVVSTEDGEKKTPHELWHGHPPDLTHLRKWGSRVLYYSKPESKLESRVMEATFVMYGKSTRQYYVIPRGTNTLRLTTNPEFREREYGYLGEWKPEAPLATPILPARTGDNRIEATAAPYAPLQTFKQMSQPWVGAHLPRLPPSVISSIERQREKSRVDPSNSAIPSGAHAPEPNDRPQPHNEVNLEPHRAPPENQGETLEEDPPENQGEALGKPSSDPTIDVDTDANIGDQPPMADQQPMFDLTEPTPDGSREPLRKAFSEPTINTSTTQETPRRSTRIRQNTERLDESIQQQRPRKRKAEGEVIGNPAQRLRAHLAQLAIATELHSVDHEYEIHESAMAAKEKAGVKLPKTYKDAVNDPVYGSKWKEAIAKELTALISFGTWRVIPRKQAEGTTSSTRWVFDVKLGLDGRIDRFKARLVARGNEQSADDFDDTFAPVFRLESLRILMAIAAQYGMTAHMLDAHNAFVGSDLDKPNCMEIPEGLQDFDADAKSGMVLELKKSLYGLRQSANLWHRKISSFLKKLGFKPITADPSVFINGRGLIIAVYVDDLLILGKGLTEIDAIKKKLKEFHPMTDGGLVSKLLGIRFKWGKNSVRLDQESYSQQILQEFGMEDCKAISTPLSPSVQLDSEGTLLGKSDHKLFRRLIGRLMFLVVATRPDIAFAVNQLSQYLAKPTQVHLGAAKHVLRYVKGTMSYGLMFGGKGSQPKLTVYSDSAYANSAKSRSTTGCVFFIGDAPIGWVSKKQPVVAQSSTEAEYIALSEAAKQAIWIRHFLYSIGKSGIYRNAPTTIYEDNQGAIKIADNPVNHPRTKHIGVRYHAIRGHMESGEVCLEYLSTDQMIADGLTKATNLVTQKRLVDGLRLA